MMLRVQYQNLTYDYVDTHTLDQLLTGKGLARFYRPSEGRWVDISRDPVRGLGGDYSGPDRRGKHQPLKPIPFDPWYSSIWSWIWIGAAVMGIVLGVLIN